MCRLSLHFGALLASTYTNRWPMSRWTLRGATEPEMEGFMVAQPPRSKSNSGKYFIRMIPPNALAQARRAAEPG